MQTTIDCVGISVKDIAGFGQSGDAGSTLHKCSQVRHLTILHDQMDVLWSVDAFEQGNNVRMLELSQDVDLRVEILSQLSGQLSCDDRLDGGV
jgi:hypothetical protein